MIIKSMATFIEQCTKVLMEIFWMCSEYDVDVFKSSILSVVKYIEINAVSEEEKKNLRYICRLLDGQFERVQHNKTFENRFTPILEYLKMNKDYIFVEKEDK